MPSDEFVALEQSSDQLGIQSTRRKQTIQNFATLGVATLVLCAFILVSVMPKGGDKLDPGLSDNEQTFLLTPTAAGAEAHLRKFTSETHVAGTAGDFHMAEYVRAQLESFGFEAAIENVSVLLNYPTGAPYVAIVDADGAEAEVDITEPALSADATSDVADRNHTFHGYSPAGDVTAEVVYANFGMPDDFETLKDLGVDVSGKIVLVRYGKCFRGLKVMLAQQHGAVGVIIYSDPNEDGSSQGTVYPGGPWRPPHGVQRGSVQFLVLCPGDPSRTAGPGTPEESCGHSQEELISQIPSIPMGYDPAALLLARMGGPTPSNFKGGLPDVPYAVGPSDFRLRLRVESEYVTTPIPNVIGRLRGSEDRSVIIGNHRDAWVYGAADPNSGTASMLEVARGLGHIKSHGWTPKRSIIVGSWSGEEYGLLGSTAWAENNAEEVKKAYAYLNVDTAVSGEKLVAGGSFALLDAFADVLGVVQGVASRPLAETWRAQDWQVLGSGSDYSVFLDHFGVPSVDFYFSRTDSSGHESPYGQYHSVYDSFDWVKNFAGGQPGRAFEYMKIAAQVWGLLALRLADADRVPFNHTREAEAVDHWVNALPADLGLDRQPLLDSVAAYKSAARAADALAGASNDQLAFTEQQFASDVGLPDRKWFRHTLQAPGFSLGYGSVVLPGITEAIEGGDRSLAQEQIQATAGAICRAASYLSGGEPSCAVVAV